MKKIVMMVVRYAPLICACILVGILALSAVWLRSSIAGGVSSKGEKTTENQNLTSPVSEAVAGFHPPALGDIIVPYQADALVFNSTTRVYETHSGVDFLCPDKRVYAYFSGRVERVTEDPLYGLTMVLFSDSGDQAVYASLSETLVKTGARVKAGDVIGVCGATAACEAEIGPHLHFEYIKNGKSHPIAFTTAPET